MVVSYLVTVWKTAQGTSVQPIDDASGNLASIFRPAFVLRHLRWQQPDFMVRGRLRGRVDSRESPFSPCGVLFSATMEEVVSEGDGSESVAVDSSALEVSLASGTTGATGGESRDYIRSWPVSGGDRCDGWVEAGTLVGPRPSV
jgi:hypothetical protein